MHKTDKYYGINGSGGFRILRVKFQEFHGWKAKFLIKTVSLIRNNAGFDYQKLDILHYSSSKKYVYQEKRCTFVVVEMVDIHQKSEYG